MNYVCTFDSDMVSLCRESKARVVFQGCQDHVVLKETLVRRVSKDRWVREGRLDPLECLAHLD